MMTIEEIQTCKESQTYDQKGIQIEAKAFGEGIIDRICSELETKGCAIPSSHVDAFILKATLMAVWTTEKEFDRPNTAQDNDTVNGMVNAQDQSVVLGIILRTTKRDLYVLCDMNLIQFVGSDKTGHWAIILYGQ